MEQTEIVELLNEKYKGKYIFDLTDTRKQIVGFIDDSSFKNVIAVIDPTKDEMYKLINHIDSH